MVLYSRNAILIVLHSHFIAICSIIELAMTSSIRKTAETIKNSPFFKGSLYFDHPLAPLTTMHVGGKAAVFVEPQDVESAAFALKTFSQEGFCPFILGGGSNLIVSDSGFSQAVLSTKRLCDISISTKDNSYTVVSAGSGAKTDDIVSLCAQKGIAGMQKFAGLPGSIGGACFMNARCYEKSISDIIESVSYLDAKDNYTQKEYSFDSKDWAYKHSPFVEGTKIIVQVKLKLALPNLDAVQRLNNEGKGYIADREQKGHFSYPSAGSVFKNNRSFGKPSGALIDECGLKGLSVGDAQIAPWHGNFIINKGKASASDIRHLIEQVQKVVGEKTGFTLEPEVIFCGN